MMNERGDQKDLLDNITTIYEHATQYTRNDRRMVAPSPELLERMKQDFEESRSARKNVERVSRLLRLIDYIPFGMNDGAIIPSVFFPDGTPVREIRNAAARRKPLRGSVRIIVVLVDFNDRPMNEPQQHYQELFFSTGVLPNGSVKEYYTDVTNGLVSLVGEVAGPYRLPRTLQEYANNESGMGITLPNAQTMARDAAEAVDADPAIDLGRYDNDGNGYIDAFIIVHAGPGAEATGNNGDIWSHKWVLHGDEYNADGTRIFAYLTIPEDAKIGVCCHELGHLLFGFPDLYDTDYSSSGIGSWCLMAGGSWNGNGDIPAQPSAWCKANQGWVEVENITDNRTISIPDVKTGRKVYRLWRDGERIREYFLVENRQKAGFDKGLPGDGLLVWHVDENIPTNSDENHPKVALLQADGQWDLESGANRGDAGDPFPGSTNNTELTFWSNPNTKSYLGRSTSVEITNISPSNSTMTAHVSVRLGTNIFREELRGEKPPKEVLPLAPATDGFHARRVSLVTDSGLEGTQRPVQIIIAD